MELVEIWLFGALLEIIGDDNYVVNELKKLNVDGYKIEISDKVKNGITGKYVDVILEHEHSHTHDQEHEHHHHHEHRNLFDVNKIIDDSSLDEKTKDLAKRIFLRVAKAESKVHNKPLEEVHFHEVGALDSIVDIIGTAILINKINPDKILASIVNDGYGFIECAHGTMSVPVPATSEIFANSNVKFRQIDVDTELVTPTGAAIIAELAEDFTTLPAMKIEKIGWLTVACRKDDMVKLQNIIFKETTTIGIRYRQESRTELQKENIEIDTKYGKMKAKKVTNNGEEYIYPEYESLKEIAEKNNIPIKELYKL